MKQFPPGTLVVLNNKVQPLSEHKGWLVPGRLCRVLRVHYLNKRKRKCWYYVALLGKTTAMPVCRPGRHDNVIGEARVPSNWLDLPTQPGDLAGNTAAEEKSS